MSGNNDTVHTYRYSSTRSDQLIVSIVGTREVINCQLDRPKLSLRSRPIFIIASTLHTDHQTCDRHALSLWRISCAFLNYLSFVYVYIYIYIYIVVAVYFCLETFFTTTTERHHIEPNTAYRTARIIIMQFLSNSLN